MKKQNNNKIDWSKHKNLVMKQGGGAQMSMPQRKPNSSMDIPELVKKVEKKFNINQPTSLKDQLKGILHKLDDDYTLPKK